MKNKNENDYNHSMSLWWLKFYFGQIIQILNAVCTQQGFIPDEHLNHYYVVAKLNVDKVLKSPELSEFAVQKPDLPSDILSSETLDWLDAWNHFARIEPENFYARINTRLVETGQEAIVSELITGLTPELVKSGFHMFPDVNAETSKVNKAVENYIQLCQGHWQKLVKNSDLSAEQDAKLADRLKPRHLIESDGQGNYTFSGHPLQITKGTLYHDIFNVIFQDHDQDGMTTYEAIEKRLIMLGHEKAEDNEQRNKRIGNALSDSQGLFSYAKYNNTDLKNETPDKRPIITIIKGKGVLFYNPIIEKK